MGHGRLGLLVSLMSLLQGLTGTRVKETHWLSINLFVWKTKQCPFKPLSSKRDTAVRLFHRSNGRLLLVLAVAQVFLGVQLPPELFSPVPSSTYDALVSYGYSIYIGGLVAVISCLEYAHQLKGGPARNAAMSRQASERRPVPQVQQKGQEGEGGRGGETQDRDGEAPVSSLCVGSEL